MSKLEPLTVCINSPILTSCMTSMMHVSYTVPVSVALSPNEALISCVSSPFLGSHTSVQALPRRVSSVTSHLHGDLSKLLVASIRSRYSPSDVIHALAMPSLPTEVTVNTLFQTLAIMDADSNGLPNMWTAEIIGVAAEVYRCLRCFVYVCSATRSRGLVVRGPSDLKGPLNGICVHLAGTSHMRWHPCLRAVQPSTLVEKEMRTTLVRTLLPT